jgi:hypothetical protein
VAGDNEGLSERERDDLNVDVHGVVSLRG